MLIKSFSKTLLVASVVSFGALTLNAQADQDTLRVATEGTYKPWSFKDASGDLQGFDVDISNALCNEMKVKCDIMAQSWDGIIPGLQAERYDAIIASMSTNPERRKKVLFTNKYKNTTTKFIALKGKFVEVNPTDLIGKKIGVQRGSSQHQWLLDQGYGKASDIVLYDNTRQPELDLISGRVDLILGNKETEASDFMTRPEAKNYEFVGPDFRGGILGEGNAIAVRLDDQQLCDKLNAALAAIIASGEYEKISKKYFSFPLL